MALEVQEFKAETYGFGSCSEGFAACNGIKAGRQPSVLRIVFSCALTRTYQGT